MSNENLWEDDGIFVDIPEEVELGNQTTSYSQQTFEELPSSTQHTQAQNESTSEYTEEHFLNEDAEAAEAEEDYSQILSDANLRLEQGNLYKLIMNHDLFSEVDADPRAAKMVQKQIRKWAKEQMEIMLGMRKETSKIERLEIDFPFNTVEVEVLKKLAFTATKGASQNSDNYVPEVKKVTEEKPTVKNKLNTIGISKPKQELTKVSTGKQKNTLKSKPTAPIKRTRLDLTIDQIAREENIPRELLEENLQGIGGKPVNEMTEEEILERNKLVSKRRQARVKSSRSVPMASFEQQQMLAMQQIEESKSSNPLIDKFLEAVKNIPIKN